MWVDFSHTGPIKFPYGSHIALPVWVQHGTMLQIPHESLMGYTYRTHIHTIWGPCGSYIFCLLGISSNNKWLKHIDSIINSASKQISCLRKLKCQLPKITLNKLYCTYIRPLLEYASEVLGGCSMSDTNR